MTDGFDYLESGELEEMKNVFFSQAHEIIEDLQDSVLQLEQEPEDDGILKNIQRNIHTLKGDSNSLGFTKVGGLCHRLEDALVAISEKKKEVDTGTIGLLLRCVDTIDSLLKSGESGESGKGLDEIMRELDVYLGPDGEEGSSVPGQSDVSEFEELQMEDALERGLKLYRIEFAFHPMCADREVGAFIFSQRLGTMGTVISSRPDLTGPEALKAESVSVVFGSMSGVDEIKKGAFIAGVTGEVVVEPYRPEDGNGAEQRDDGSANKDAGVASYAQSTFMRVEVAKIDRIMNLVGELIIGRSAIEQVARDAEEGASSEALADRLSVVNSYLERTISDLQMGAMKMRMVPINHAFRKFPKVVRDISSEKGKKVRLVLEGKETELDKGVVDAIHEPLSHVIRNFIDHGIEEPGLRLSQGKPEEGVITLNAYHEANQIVIEASDDGAGIDTVKLKAKAVEKGFISAAEAERMSGSDAVNLIFLSGLSTSDFVSETSGRGVGMDAVKSATDGMKGTVDVDSKPAEGTTFTFRLPLTLAVIKALLFELGAKVYAVPISAVAEVLRVSPEELSSVKGMDTLLLRNHVVSLLKLDELLSAGSNGGSSKFAIVLGASDRRVGFLVDRLQGQQELVIKAVDDNYLQSSLVAGASILGSGRVVLILDPPAIFAKAVQDEKRKARA